MHILLLSGVVPFAILGLVLSGFAVLLVVSTALAFPYLPLFGLIIYWAYRHRPRLSDSEAPYQPT
jgi:hypothetical protein